MQAHDAGCVSTWAKYHLKMIPRAKVNYDLRQLAKAFFLGKGDKDYRSILISLLRDYLREPNILLTPSGRGGLYFILKAIEKPRLIVPAYTCNAVVEAAQLAGKEVVYADVEESGYNISISELARVVDENSIVVATHQFGFPCRISEILELCRDRKATVIEDAAASFGSRVNGKLTGTFADAAFFSFDSTKLINVPLKGGFIIAKDKALFDRIRATYQQETESMPISLKTKLIIQAGILVFLQNHLLYRIFHWLRFGLTRKYTAESAMVSRELNPYYRYDMANWQAYLAAPQINMIEQLINKRRLRYAEYMQKLKGFSGFDLPPMDNDGEWACIRFPIRVRGDKFSYYDKIARLGVDCAFSFTFITCPDTFANARLLATQVLDLPFYHKLKAKELNKVASVLRTVDGEAKNEPS